MRSSEMNNDDNKPKLIAMSTREKKHTPRAWREWLDAVIMPHLGQGRDAVYTASFGAGTAELNNIQQKINAAKAALHEAVQAGKRDGVLQGEGGIELQIEWCRGRTLVKPGKKIKHVNAQREDEGVSIPTFEPIWRGGGREWEKGPLVAVSRGEGVSVRITPVASGTINMVCSSALEQSNRSSAAGINAEGEVAAAGR